MNRRDLRTTVLWIVVHAAVVAATVALLLAEPIAGWVGSATGIDVLDASPLRRALLAAASVVILLRMAVTGLILLPRRMGMGEAIVVDAWLAIIHLTFAIAGASNPHPVGVFVWLGVGLFVAGRTINTASEIGRRRFKLRPENAGRLYTGGLFSCSMHVNYFGDVLWCTGAAMITGRAIALVIPLLMTAMFVWIHIPRLDAHLAQKYGEQFDRYRRTTKKLVPGVY